MAEKKSGVLPGDELITTVDVTLKVPKETKEVIDLLGAIGDKIDADAPISDYMDLISELTAAVKDAKKIKAETKSGYKEDIAAYLFKRVGGAFL